MTAPSEQREPSLAQLLHEVWLAVHVRRFQARGGAVDSFYGGVQVAEQAVAEVAARYGVSEREMREGKA